MTETIKHSSKTTNGALRISQLKNNATNIKYVYMSVCIYIYIEKEREAHLHYSKSRENLQSW